MATIKAVLAKNKIKSDGSIPIAIRISENNKSTYQFLGKSIKEKDWDAKAMRIRKSHPYHDALNTLISIKKAEAEKKITLIQIHQDGKSLIDTVRTNEKKQKRKSFFEIGEEYLIDLERSQKFNRFITDRGRLKHFKLFMKRSDVDLKDVNEQLLRKFMIYLKSYKGCGERTIMNYLILVRVIMNKGLKLGLIDLKDYPFGEGKIRIKLPESIKVGLNEEEVKKLEAIDLSSDSKLDHSRNLWLFSFYFAGIRISDVFRLKWRDIQDGRLLYRMGKNSKVVSLEIPEKANKILEKYKFDEYLDEDYVFPELRGAIPNDAHNEFIKIRNANHSVDERLKILAEKAGIKKKLTFHIARHTFGNISGEKIHPIMLQKLYRHSDLKTTIGYQANFITKAADEALRKVLDF